MMKNNKVILGDGTVVMDISDTTAESDDVKEGKLFYDKRGEQRSGTGSGGGNSFYIYRDVTTIEEIDKAYHDGKDMWFINTIDGKSTKDVVLAIQDTSKPSMLNKLSFVTIAESGHGFDNWIIKEGQPYQRTLIEFALEGVVDGLANRVLAMENTIESINEQTILLDFILKFNATIPSCTKDIENTQIPKVTVDIDLIDSTGVLGDEYAVASLVKYEVYDAETGGARVNCWPVCMFSENKQRKLSVRFVCAGTTDKSAKRIQGAILLQKRTE